MLSTDSFNITYNARHLKPEDVAKTFIFNSDYEELIQNNHSVLLGPRGCGKTTLMKMITLPALNAWTEPIAEKIRSNIPFYAIYISTDIYWNAQKDSYHRQLKTFPKFADVVSKVAVTTNVLYSLCETFENIIKFELTKDEIKETELAKALIGEWALPPTIPHLSMIKESLLKRTDKLNRFIQKTVFNAKSDTDIELVDEYYFLDFDSSASLAIAIFERLFFAENVTKKWALCFDELELAPDWLQNRLFESLRSRSQKVLYKLSASPIVSLPNTMVGTPGNDLKLVKMWPHGLSNKYHDFSEKMVETILFKKFGQNIPAEKIFGSNPLFRKDHEVYDYAEGGGTWNEIKELAESDRDLVDLLRKHNIDPKDPTATKETRGNLDTLLRKIKPIVYFRNYYSSFDEDTGVRKSRSRKASTLFYGKEVIYKICDGNPRWLIGIVNEMLQKCDDAVRKIDEPTQASILQMTARHFNNVIKTIPEAIVERSSTVFTLSGILKEIGEYFFSEIVLGKFQRDPHSSFVIDSKIDDEFVKVLEKAVYQGAIILIDPSENAFDFEMKGKRFRLSYLFCPMFKIPLRTYAELPLSKCLSGKEAITFNQPELPFNEL